jgi:Zn-finger nucleic acid-binding protein
MAERLHDRVRVLRCDSCGGVFLDRADLADLVEGENEWHAHRSADTSRLPRITPDMPPPSTARARAYVESLFDQR